MSGSLVAVTALYAAALGGLAFLAAVRPPRHRAHLTSGAVILEILLVVVAGSSVWTMLSGHRPAEPATHVGYLACSVLLLPLLVVRPRTDRDTRWDSAVLGVAAVGVGVVVLRVGATWAS